MEQNGFLTLFMETGEPYFWLLSRAEDRTKPSEESRPAKAAEEELTLTAPQ